MGNSASGLPYTIGDKIGESDGWDMHQGSQKTDGAAVTVFKASKPVLAKALVDRRFPQSFQIFPAYHHFQHCRKLRHPHILNVHATLDTDYPEGQDKSAAQGGANPANLSSMQQMATTGDLIIVTEPCIPLHEWLAQPGRKPEHIAWGLQCMVEALCFLHTSAKLAHGNISETSWYVTPGGDVKLWSFSLVTPVGVADGGGGPTRHFREWEALLTPNAYRSPERKENRWEAVATCGIHCMDSYGLGIMMTSCLYKNQVPGPLQKAVQRLETPNLKMRPRLAPLLKCPVFDTPYRTVQVQLNELSVQPVEAKVAFWQNLMPALQGGTLDQSLAIHKVLPQMQSTIMTICQSESMLSQDMYRREILAIVQPLFYICETYLNKDDGSVGKLLSPLVALLFAVSDRGVRGALLSKANLLAANLSRSELNNAIFDPMCSGFSDSSPALRELTLKATLVLVPHLTPPHLEKLSRYLVRLQSDTEASIRTNTVVFIGKLAPHLTEMNREKMLLPAFVRAMKDPFTPCRLAALKATLKADKFFDPKGIATKVMPAVMPLLLDPVADVRREAFSVVDAFMLMLRREDERMSIQEGVAGGPSAVRPVAESAPSLSTPPKPAPAPSSTGSGGYLSGLSSWVTTAAKPSDVEPAAAVPHASRSASSNLPFTAAPASAPARPEPKFSSLGLNDAHIGGGAVNGGFGNSGAAGDGWDDDDDDDLLGDFSGSSSKPMDDDDIFASLDIKPKKVATLGGGSGASKSGSSKLVMPKTTVAQRKAARQEAAVKKLEADLDDNWDDF